MTKKLMSIWILLIGVGVAHTAAAGKTELSAECTWHAEAGCEASCEGLSFHTECEAEINASCEVEGCNNLDIQAECEGSCSGGCTAECTGEPGSFDCEGYCGEDCSASCSGHCEGACATECEADGGGASCEAECQGSCEGSCEADCDARCSASCDLDLPEIDCEAECEASCEGSCEASVEFDCQVDCEADAYAKCTATFEGECEARCDADGFLECNGEFIDKEDLEAAIAWVDAHFDLTYEAEGECANGKCEGSASASVRCSVSTLGQSNQNLWLGSLISAIF